MVNEIEKQQINQHIKTLNSQYLAGKAAGKPSDQLLREAKDFSSNALAVGDLGPETSTFLVKVIGQATSVSQLISYWRSLLVTDMFSVSEYARKGQDVTIERNMALDDYSARINSYIEQSRQLLDNLPPKSRVIVEKMKSEQSTQYTLLKDIAREQKDVSNSCIKLPLELTGTFPLYDDNFKYDSIPLTDFEGKKVAVKEVQHFVMRGNIRAFFCKLPSITGGLPLDIIYAAGSNGVITKKYMHIKNIRNRAYSFKYKAWWGPMTRIIEDIDNFTDKGMYLILRCKMTTDAAKKVEDKGFGVIYVIKDLNSYRDYLKTLKKVRSLNFKIKSTVQRFVRGNMAKFLNTDKKIVNEISNYTYAGK